MEFCVKQSKKKNRRKPGDMDSLLNCLPFCNLQSKATTIFPLLFILKISHILNSFLIGIFRNFQFRRNGETIKRRERQRVSHRLQSKLDYFDFKAITLELYYNIDGQQ